MKRLPHFRTWAVLLFVAVGLVSVPTSRAQGPEEGQHSSIRLRRWAIKHNSAGRLSLTINIGNYGRKPVNVAGIMPGDGAETVVGQAVEPGHVLTWTISVEEEPAFVWLSTDGGRVRLDLVPSE